MSPEMILPVAVSAICFAGVIPPMMQTEDEEGFETLFRTFRDPLFRATWVSTGDWELAEDAVSEAFARAYERWPEVSRHPAPTAWVAKTALNFVRTQRRRDRGRIDVIPPALPVADDLPMDPDLVRRVLGLPTRQREVVALRVLLDLSTDQTAKLLGIAPGTVTAHLFRALSRLEKEFVASTDKEARNE